MTTLKHPNPPRMPPRYNWLTVNPEVDAAEEEALKKLTASVLTYNRIIDFFCGLSLSALVVCLGIFAYQAIELSL